MDLALHVILLGFQIQMAGDRYFNHVLLLLFFLWGDIFEIYMQPHGAAVHNIVIQLALSMVSGICKSFAYS